MSILTNSVKSFNISSGKCVVLTKGPALLPGNSDENRNSFKNTSEVTLIVLKTNKKRLRYIQDECIAVVCCF